jgi:hypothetical protein
LLHLRGIEIAAITAAVPASATVAKATAIAATVAATIVNLRESVANAQSKGQGHRAHRNHASQFHRMFFVVFGFAWFSWLHGQRNRLADRALLGQTLREDMWLHWPLEKVSKQSRLKYGRPAQITEILRCFMAGLSNATRLVHAQHQSAVEFCLPEINLFFIIPDLFANDADFSVLQVDSHVPA